MNSPENQSDKTNNSASAPSSSAPNVAPPDDSLVIVLPDESSTQKDIAMWASVLVILTLIAYWPVTDAKFIWNDGENVAQNYLLGRPGGLAKMWSQRWTDQKNDPLPQYHPVAFTSYWLDYQLFGHDTQGLPTPFAYHLTNLLLHATAVVLVWLVLRKLKLPGAWLAAAVFALHPINTEAVGWISQRASVLAGALFFGSIYTYLLFLEDDDRARLMEPVDPARQWGLYAGSFLLFILAMLSKSPAFAMPFVMALILWWKRRLTPRQLALLAPFMLIGIALAFSAADFERDFANIHGREVSLDFGQRLIIAGRALWFYLAKLIVPVRLTFMYPKWSPNSAIVLQYAPFLAAMAVCVLLLVAHRRVGRGPVVAVGAFVLCLFPSLGFYELQSMRYSYVFDHCAYLAGVPIIAAIIAAAAKALQRVKMPQPRVGTVAGLSAILLVAAGAATWARTHVFASPVDLWQDTIAKNPNFAFAHDELANEFGAQGAGRAGERRQRWVYPGHSTRDRSGEAGDRTESNGCTGGVDLGAAAFESKAV